ncbi:helix-turn-helix domain-containing protein [Flavobacterium sp.]|uniref:helix-turn-helix domain-containing protein n=1 Tax=Flavobacterium sp. TaxID=239 RepID=UPI002637F201|nr:helix-turn-helix domain-containing protein [Flavobacterium sp.]
MLFQFNIYSGLLLIFFTHNLVYALILLQKSIQERSKSAFWLALFLIIVALYLAPWMLGFAGWYDSESYRAVIFSVPFHQLYFFGPILYFYTQAVLNPAFTFRKKYFWHLLPGFLYLLYALIQVANDYYGNGGAFPEFYADIDFDEWYQISGHVSMLCYLIYSLKYYNLYRKVIQNIVSFADELTFKYVKEFIISCLVIIGVDIGFRIAFEIFPEFANFIGSWWYYMAVGVISYRIAIRGYANENFRSKRVGYGFVNESKIENAEILAEYAEIEFPQSDSNNLGLTESEEKLRDQLEKLLITNGYYKNPELTLLDLAKATGSNTALISKVINKGFNQNFNDLVNTLRIDAFKAKVAAGENSKSTLLGLGLDCGFNSKATFNRAFKKHTGVTPKDYLAKNTAELGLKL